MSLTDKQKVDMINLYRRGGQSQESVAKQFGVSGRTLRRILNSCVPVAVIDTDEFQSIYHYTDDFDMCNVEEDEPTVDEIDPSQVTVVMTSKSIRLNYRGEHHCIDNTSKNFACVRDAIFKDDFALAFKLIDVRRSIEHFTNGRIDISDGKIKFKGFDVPESQLAKRIFEMMKDGDEGFKTLVAFLDRVIMNPEKRAVVELFSFLEHNDIKINEDGTFTCWKVVTKDYLDKHTKTIDNSVGQLVEMPRHMVNANSAETCSTGLHVCAKRYIGTFVSSYDKVMACIVDPVDVVSIPNDYNNSKMRCCRYKVVEDVTERFS